MARDTLRERGSTVPIYSLLTGPGDPFVSTLPLDGDAARARPPRHPHAHDFLALAYFERDGGSIRLGNRAWQVSEGDIYVIPPGEVVEYNEQRESSESAGWGISFSHEVFGPHLPAAFLSWRTHPLLFPFVHGAATQAHRLNVPPDERRFWSARIESLDLELQERREGYREATLAYLTLLLVDVARLMSDVAGELRLSEEPLLADVFTFIEESYREAISLSDVARALNLTSGYLTTIVRQKTGRTVQDWIAERRMIEARRLLVESDLAVEEIGRKVGYRNASYFARTFRRIHGVTPLTWRRTGRR